ncbi:MAG: GFA family protein [Proteobacteria bacterium]|nr:GFA family protein [Pseudomonadota bacterium]
MALTGQCLCGDVTYTIENVPAVTGVCHCKNCQRQAGSAFSTLAGIPKAEFKFTSGTPKLYEDAATDSGNPVERYFCGRCGSPIYSALPSQPEMLYLKTGTLDDTSSFKPQFHAWCDSKQTWVVLEKDVAAMGKQT